MNFKLIDISQWDRREYFEYYLNQTPCSYSMTLNLDLTGLLKEIKKQNIKLYPTMINLLSMIVNKHEEFRTAIDKDERVGVFDFLLYFNALQKESIFFRIRPSTRWIKKIEKHLLGSYFFVQFPLQQDTRRGGKS